MRLPFLTLLFVILALAGCGGLSRDEPVDEEIAGRFAFERGEPKLEEGGRRERTKGLVDVQMSYPSPGGDVVTGYLVRPTEPAGSAGVVLLHGKGGSAADFLREARLLARRGAVVLTLDSPFARSSDSKIREGRAELQKTYETMVQYIQDVLRAFDVLVEQYGVDESRLAVVGYSHGAQPAVLAAALEPRVRSVVIMAGHAYPSGLPDDLLARRLFTAIDTVEFVDNLAPARLLIQGGEFDPVVSRAELEILFEQASEPKEIRWYDADHGLGPKAGAERLAWLVDQLELG